MKYFFHYLVYMFLHVTIQAQTLSAKYLVTTNMDITLASGKVKQETINYSGILYKRNGRYIYLEKPGYLSKYPTGTISIEDGNNSQTVYTLGKDSILFISYADTDSLLERWRLKGLPGDTDNSLRYFDSSLLTGTWANQWQISNETKDINGLHCRKAVSPGQWQAWYCPDIPIQFGPYFIVGLPGLVVEADKLSMGNRHYALESYVSGTDISTSVFWPAEFNEPFKKLPHLKNRPLPGKTTKTRQQKQADILDQ
jgi:GLPGLI family protein